MSRPAGFRVSDDTKLKQRLAMLAKAKKNNKDIAELEEFREHIREQDVLIKKLKAIIKAFEDQKA